MPRRRPSCSFSDEPFSGAVEAYARNLLIYAAQRVTRPADLKRLGSDELFRQLLDGNAGSAEGPDDRGPQRFQKDARVFASHALQKAASSPRGSETVEANLDLLGRLLGLDPTHVDVLRLLLALHDDPSFESLVDAFGNLNDGQATRLIAAAIGAEEDSVAMALDPRSRLLTSGLVQKDRDLQLSDRFDLKADLLSVVTSPRLDAETLLSKFLDRAPPSTIEWADFEHLHAEAGVARNLLRAALAARTRGVNLLFYGATGTGKTALAHLLGVMAGTRLYSAGKSDAAGGSASYSQRLASVLLAYRLLVPGDAILLFDELEDLFSASGLESVGGRMGTAFMSKQWFNDLLETNPIPTIWITNEVTGMDPAFLRRFTYAVEFRSAGVRQRVRALERHLGRDHRLAPDQIRGLAERFEVSPAHLGTAVAAARLLAADGLPDRPALEQVLSPAQRLLHGGEPRPRQAFDPASYRIEAINATTDLVALSAQLANWRPTEQPGLSLCLYGPPGTGKSEFVHHLAHCMGRRVIHRRASDILSMWVGGTEKAIAEAFREAGQNDSVLLFDEVDSLLRDRQSAERSWEVTQVNEFLQQLEVFPGVVACTTNLDRDLDPASMRRFIFKVGFGYLRPEQALVLFIAAFAEHLASPVAPEEHPALMGELARLSNLTPGDFAAVARRLRALSARKTASELLGELREEVKAKRASAAPIGFGSQARPLRIMERPHGEIQR